MLEAEFGSDGVVVILKLLSRFTGAAIIAIGKTTTVCFLPAKRWDGMAAETVRAIVAKAVERGLFDRESFERHAILTSVEIQEQFFTVAARRKRVLSNGMDYLLIDLSKYKSVRVKEFPQPKAEMDAKSSDLPEQSKGKEKKGKKSKEHSLAPLDSGECGREQWVVWKEELLADEDWRASAVRQAGQGVGFNDLLPGKIDEFCDFLVSTGEKKSAGT